MCFHHLDNVILLPNSQITPPTMANGKNGGWSLIKWTIIPDIITALHTIHWKNIPTTMYKYKYKGRETCYSSKQVLDSSLELAIYIKTHHFLQRK